MKKYDPMNHYWNIDESDSQVFSSALLLFAPLSDATYLAWVAEDDPDRTTRIDTAENLYDVLAQQYIPTYLANGIAVISTGTPEVNGTYPLDEISQNRIAGISAGINSGSGVPGGGEDFVYNGKTFTAGQFVALAKGLADFVYNFNLALGTYLSSNGVTGTLPSLPVVIA